MKDVLSAGRLEDHPFAELSGLLFQGSRTGELILESGNRHRTVWFLGGNPVAVVSRDPQEHLAQFLLEHGKIGDDDARRLAELPETREALGSADFLPKETLNWGVKSRFVNLCYDLFRWEEGDYTFHEGEPPRELFLLKVPAHSLIFKGVGLLGQATVIDAVPDDAVCTDGAIAAADARYLTPEALQFLKQCQPGRTVAEALGGGSADRDQARRLLYALACLGLVSVSRGPARDEDPGFFLEDDAAETSPTSAPAVAIGASDFAGFPLDDQPKSEEFTLNLPPLGSGSGSLPLSDSDPFSTAADQLPGSFPFNDASGPESFGSYNPDAPLEDQEDAPAPEDDDLDVPEKDKTKSGRRFHLPRIAGIALGSLAAVGLIAVAGWWWMSGSEPPAPPVKPPARRPVSTATAPVASTSAPVPVPIAQPAAPAPSAVPTAPPAPPAKTVPPPAPVTAAPAPPAPPAAVAKAPAPRSTAGASGSSAADRYRNGLEIFRAGDLDGAAAIWESLLAEERRSAFTLQILTACQPDTIRETQRSLTSHELYLVSRKVNGRNCFRVCLGTFASRDDAGRALAGLPGAYRAGGAAVRPVAEVLDRAR